MAGKRIQPFPQAIRKMPRPAKRPARAKTASIGVGSGVTFENSSPVARLKNLQLIPYQAVARPFRGRPTALRSTGAGDQSDF